MSNVLENISKSLTFQISNFILYCVLAFRIDLQTKHGRSWMEVMGEKVNVNDHDTVRIGMVLMKVR